MSKSIHSLLRVRRNTLASAAALAFVAAAPAMANTTDNGYYEFGSYDGSADQTLALNNYVLSITSPQLSTAAMTGSAAGISYQAWLSGPAAMGTPVVQTGNGITAFAGGNQATSNIGLGLLAQGADGSDGAAIMTGQVRRDAASQALVSGSGVSIHLDGVPVADQVISANTLSAITTLNQSASSIDGVLPAGYASTRPGSASTWMGLGGSFGNEFDPSGMTLDSRTGASVGITTAQVSSNAGQRAGSAASLLGSDVTLAATGQGGFETPNPLAAQLAITGNELSAQYSGNRASSRFNAQAGPAPFQGSVAVSSLQSNAEDAGQSFGESGMLATAVVADTAIRADLRGGEGARSVLTGALAITGNTVLAASTGNDATARDGAGNAIVLAGGTEVRGGQSPRINMGGAFGASAGSDVMADLALASVQGNRDTGFVSQVNNTGISATLDQLGAGASVALDRNSIGASAIGNTAGNRIQADASLLSATAAASNVQSNSSTGVSAANVGGRIASNIGTAGLDTSGSVSLSSNRLSAVAGGNVADTQVALSATNLATGGMPAFAGAAAWQGGFAVAGADASAVNVQSNQGGTVTAMLAGGGIAASFADQASGEGMPGGVQGASVALKNNVLRSQAIGNDATTGVSLAATTASTSAALASMQTSSAWLGSSLTATAVTASTGNLGASSVSLDGNWLASAAIANRADNQLQVSLGSLQSGGSGVGGIGFMDGGAGANTASGGMGSAVAAVTLANAQRNDGTVNSTNLSGGALVQASVGSNNYGYNEGYGLSGVVASTISVTDNLVAAASTGNQAANTLSLQAGSIAGNGLNAPVAAVNSVQSGSSEGYSQAVAGGVGGAQLIGVRVDGQLASSTVAVTGNTVSATNLGNTVANQLRASGTSLVAAIGGEMPRDLRADPASGSVRNDFSLVNQQTDGGAGRAAWTTNASIGIDDSQSFMAWGAIGDSTLTVSGNRNLAEARNNNAVNGIALGGYALLGAGAGLLNSQSSSGPVSADAVGQTNIRTGGMGVFESTMALTDNVTRALAVANSAANSVVAQATTLQGSGAATPMAGDMSTSEAGSGVASGADFALGNVQSHSGPVVAGASSANRIDLGWNVVFGGTASVTGNTVAGIAQANSASNTLALAATTASGVTGAVSSMQSADGSVSARADAPSEQGAFLVAAPTLVGIQATVSNNSLRASAGQNEAFNQLSVTAASIGGGNNPSAFTLGPVQAAGGSSFSVASQQSGAGSVDATALPGRIGVVADGTYGANLSVSGNQVAATAGMNTASNALTLAAATLGASGSVSNLQSTAGGAVTAMVGSSESPMLLGVMVPALNGTAVAVTGNSLAAQAGGNSGTNLINASGTVAAAQGAATPSFAILNSQSNAASMNAAVRNATIGVVANGYEGGMGMNSASAAVQANSVTASGYGNTASNAIALGMPQAAAGAATAGLTSRQTNTAAIGAAVSNVTIGVFGTASGSNGVISGNSVSAQAVGNSVVNAISMK